MPSSAASSGSAGDPGGGAERARHHLLAELRAAREAAVGAGADPDAVTADLEARVRRLRRMLANDEASGD